MLLKARISVPLRGFSPFSNSASITTAPDPSLPWVNAVTITVGPGLPLSNT
jgi:hypothetical protein